MKVEKEKKGGNVQRMQPTQGEGRGKGMNAFHVKGIRGRWMWVGESFSAGRSDHPGLVTAEKVKVIKEFSTLHYVSGH